MLIGLIVVALLGLGTVGLLRQAGCLNRARGAPIIRRPFAPGSVLDLAGYKMVRIEAGEFKMGSPEAEAGRYTDESLHPVRLSHPFLIGSTEVTAGLWRRAAMNPRTEQAAVDPRMAVPYVDWFAAIQFCQGLSQLEGLDPAYKITPHDAQKGEVSDTVIPIPGATGYRLPTEAEWEYAARAGSQGLYGGDRSRVNAWGLYDMSGNLWEWVWDRPGPYPSSATDPSGAEHGLFHILRGGSWRSPARQLRAAMRGWSPLFVSDETTGFRIARSLPEQSA